MNSLYSSMKSRSELPALDMYLSQQSWQLFWLLEKVFSGIMNSWRLAVLQLNDTDLICIYTFASHYVSSAVVVLMLIIDTPRQGFSLVVSKMMQTPSVIKSMLPTAVLFLSIISTFIFMHNVARRLKCFIYFNIRWEFSKSSNFSAQKSIWNYWTSAEIEGLDQLSANKYCVPFGRNNEARKYQDPFSYPSKSASSLVGNIFCHPFHAYE